MGSEWHIFQSLSPTNSPEADLLRDTDAPEWQCSAQILLHIHQVHSFQSTPALYYTSSKSVARTADLSAHLNIHPVFAETLIGHERGV